MRATKLILATFILGVGFGVTTVTAMSPEAEEAPAAGAVDELSEEATPRTPIPIDRPGVVSVALKAAPLGTAIEQITLNAHYDLVMPSNDFKITIFLYKASIAQAMDAICRVADLEYRLDGRIMTVWKPQPPPTE